MKKIILPFIFAFCAASNSFAQSFTLSETGPLTHTEPASTSEMESFEISVTNNSSESKNVFVERNIVNAVEGGSFYYCWALCYSAGYVLGHQYSPTGMTIGAGEMNINFSAHYNSNGIVGVNTIEYCFFDENNTSDKTCITLNHDATGSVSIQEVSGESNFLSSPQPNPANTSTSIVYNLASLNNGKIVLRNMLGSIIKEIQLDKASDSKIIDVTALNVGIYFYSLVNNGKIVSSQRLIVK
jgi:hypothetical protein